MFNPNTEEVRRFFCGCWRRRGERAVLTPLEAIAIKWIERHPEYESILADEERALAADFGGAGGQSNPFLHLSMHLALEEQRSIDQPAGVRALLERLAVRAGDEHAGAHEAMECLGQVLWETQRGTLPADTAVINVALLECLQRAARLPRS